MPEDEALPQVINVNVAGIQSGFMIGIQRLWDILVYCNSGLLKVDESNFQTWAPFQQFHTAPNLPLDYQTLKATAAEWLLKTFFNEAIDLTGTFLDECRLVCGIFKVASGGPFTGAQFNQLTSVEAKRFHRLGLPDKLDFLKTEFGVNSEISEHVLSLNRARNCLVHRLGVVGAQDVDATGALTLKWRASQLIEITATGDERLIAESGHMVSGPATIALRIQELSKAFALGEKVTLTTQELFSNTMTLFLFASTISQSITSYGQSLGLIGAIPPPSTG